LKDSDITRATSEEGNTDGAGVVKKSGAQKGNPPMPEGGSRNSREKEEDVGTFPGKKHGGLGGAKKVGEPGLTQKRSKEKKPVQP